MVSQLTIATLTAVCVLANFAPAHGYSGGAPVEVCDDMTPKHPAEPQKGKMPYSVAISNEIVKAGQTVKITISGKNGFKGFIAQVRQGSKQVGQFIVGDKDKYVKTINCGEGQQVIFEMFKQFITFLVPDMKRFFTMDMLQNAATHKNSELKNNLSIDWKAPSGLKDSVQVYVTVAQDGGTYWVAQPTALLKLN